jgi:magnesium chelatase subunit D
VPTGGRTPLARALSDAAQLTCARSSSVLVLFTDGRANVAESAVAGADDSADPWLQALAAARALADQCSAALVVDCETGPVTLGRARLLAEALKGEWVSLQELESSDMTIRLRVDRSGSVRA